MKKSRFTGKLGGPQRGSTMIEVMISVVILALGMMGMLGMFINSLKITSGALYRNVAAQHAYMMADVLRANMINIESYFTPTATSTSSCFSAAGCLSNSSKTIIANSEYTIWENQLGNLLPAGQGVVCRDATPTASSKVPTSPAAFLVCDNSTSGQVVVKVCWDETRIQNSNASIQTSNNSSTGAGQCIFTNL